MLDEDIPDSLKCGLCSQACKRGVKVPCCNTRACRGCATKHVTRTKVCWNEDCGVKIRTGDMIIDQELRDDVDKFLCRVKSDMPVLVLDDNKKQPEVYSGDLITKDEQHDNYASNSGTTFTNYSNAELKQDRKEDNIIAAEKESTEEICEKDTINNEDTKAKTIEELPAFESNDDDSVPREEKIETPGELTNAECPDDVSDFYETEALSMDVICEEDIDTPETESMNMGVSLAKMRERNSEFERCMSPVERACKELRFGAQLELMLKFETNRARCLMCGKTLGTEFLIMKHLQLKHKDEYERLRIVLEITNMNTLNMFVHKAIRSEFLFQQKEVFPIPVDN